MAAALAALHAMPGVPAGVPRVLRAARALAHYGRLLVWPTRLSVFVAVPPLSLADTATFLAAAAPPALTLALLAWAPGAAGLGAWAAAAALHVPTLGFVQVSSRG